MRKPKKRSRAPWVVEHEHLVKWVLNSMPVRYKWKTMYIDPTMTSSSTHVCIYERNKDGTRGGSMLIPIDDIDVLLIA